MLSEKHNAFHIGTWIRYWFLLGAPLPKECISDDGAALVIAEINALTRYLTVTEYANACFMSKPISCYIRIDVAHFIKKYSRFFTKADTLVKRFYLGAIGQLILCRSLKQAEQILRMILICCRSSSCGKKSDGQPTKCSESIEAIKKLIVIQRNDEMDRVIETSIEGSTKQV